MATVLVVDDVAENREILTLLLNSRGHEVLEAGDVDDALDVVRVRHPDIVVSDVLVPGIDGLELVHRPRSDDDPAAASPPVILYTAGHHPEPETRSIADACGVALVVLRDTDPRDLFDAVDEALAAGPDTALARVHSRTVTAELVEKERALKHSERRFEVMATASPVGIALLGPDGDATYVNPRLTEITGETAGQLTGRGWLTCLEPRVRREALDVVRHADTETVEHLYRTHLIRADLTERWLRVHLRPILEIEDKTAGAVVMIDDISDVVAAEQRLAHEAGQRQVEAARHDEERLDSLRRLAGGIAHDFNNLHGSMLGFAQLAGDAVAAEEDAGRLDHLAAATILEDLGQITRGGRRATMLTEQLLAFGRREINDPVIVDLNSFISAFVRDFTAERVAVTLWLADDTPPARIDRRCLDRLLHILLRNSCEAMPAGGTITVSTSAEPVGGTAVIEVADSGIGMTPEVKRRAFEPFFSTKPGIRTAGLGLSTAHGIVSQAGGDIALTARPGMGTTVRVSLPVAVRATTRDGPGPPGTAARDPGGRTTVLLVDDDEAVRGAAERFIAKGGYRILSAGCGSEALRLAREYAGSIHCLVAEALMPGMDGHRLAQRMIELWPEIRVVFLSGSSAAPFVDEGGRGCRVVAKPFTGAQLREAIAAELGTVR